MSAYSTGNTTRDDFIRVAIGKVRTARNPTPMGVATVSHFLPQGFDLDGDELSGILSTLPDVSESLRPWIEGAEAARARARAGDEVTFEDEHTGEVPFDPASGAPVQPIRSRKIARVSETLENIEPPRANESEKSAGQPVTAQQMQDVVNAAQRRLENARINVRQRTAELQAKRTAMAKAIASWQSGQPKHSWEENARAEVAASQAARAARVAAGGPGTSATAAAYVRKRMQNGGRSRGAFPASWLGRTDPRYVPPAPKVPSDR